MSNSNKLLFKTLLCTIIEFNLNGGFDVQNVFPISHKSSAHDENPDNVSNYFVLKKSLVKIKNTHLVFLPI